MKAYHSDLPVVWPKNPKEGDWLYYPCVFSGNTVSWFYKNNQWVYNGTT